jgi:branched-chain amino acid transport system substrate-binding protein
VQSRTSQIKLAIGALTLVAAIIAAALGGSTSGAADPLGKPNKATKSPIVFGMINLESGPIVFPEARIAAQAGIKYVNAYKGGLKGHPIKLLTCATDGTPATSARCANQLAGKHVVAMLGATDTGGGGSYPVFGRNKLSVIGGVPFTPVESNAKNGVMFMSVAVADNAAAVTYAKQSLKAKSIAILQTDNTQGNYTGSIIANVAKNVGMKVKQVEVPVSAADLSSSAASAIGSNPDLIYIEVPNACAPMLKALKSLGYKGHLMAIDPCTAPPVLAAAGNAAQGMFVAGPYYNIDSSQADAKLAGKILGRFAPKNLAYDSLAFAGLSEIINLQTISNSLPEKKLTSAGLLAAFKDGKQHPNFMGHAMLCDGKQVPAQSASCDKWQIIKKVSGNKIVQVNGKWVTGAQNYKP